MNCNEDINVDFMCRYMSMVEFADALSRLPYSTLVMVHEELVGRISCIDEQIRSNEGAYPEWTAKVNRARRILARKAAATASRVESAQRFTLARFASRGKLLSLRDEPAVQVKFLIGLIDRLVDPATIDDDERIILDACRSSAMASVHPES